MLSILSCCAVLASAVRVQALVVDEAAAGLISAVRSNDLETVAALLEESGNAAVGLVIGPGVTPLHIAAALDLEDMLALLVERGADINARTHNGFTPLHWAAGRDASRAIEFLLGHHADPSSATANGITPLHWAANNNATNAVKLLLNRGVNPLPKTVSGQTPLHWAVLKQAHDAAIDLAFRAVSEEMEKEPEIPAADRPETEAAGVDGEEPPSKPVDGSEVDLLPRPAFGRKLVVPLGFGEQLSFIWLDALKLWVGEFEVTNGQFRRFRPAHDSMFQAGFSLNGNDQPAVYVSWNDANDFCRWLNKHYAGRVPRDCVFRLPTDREWQTVAQCGDNRLYPWGNQWPPRYGNFSDLSARKAFSDWEGIRGYDDGYAVTCPVQSSGANEWGLYGLGGNVWEWCSDWYDAAKTYKIRRGGGWDFDGETSLRVDARGFDRPDAKYDTIGLRLMVSPKGRPMVETVRTSRPSGQ